MDHQIEWLHRIFCRASWNHRKKTGTARAKVRIPKDSGRTRTTQRHNVPWFAQATPASNSVRWTKEAKPYSECPVWHLSNCLSPWDTWSPTGARETMRPMRRHCHLSVSKVWRSLGRYQGPGESAPCHSLAAQATACEQQAPQKRRYTYWWATFFFKSKGENTDFHPPTYFVHLSTSPVSVSTATMILLLTSPLAMLPDSIK